MKTSYVFPAMLALGATSVYAADTHELARESDIVPVAVAPAVATSVVRQHGDAARAGSHEISAAEPRLRERPMLDRELGTASEGGYEYYERSER